MIVYHAQVWPAHGSPFSSDITPGPLKQGDYLKVVHVAAGELLLEQAAASTVIAQEMDRLRAIERQTIAMQDVAKP
jgi:hypothetical protein